MTQTVDVGTGVTLTPAAVAKVASLLADEGPGLALRIAVAPGGCAGLRYELFFDDQTIPGDLVSQFDEVRVVVDAMSAPYLGGVTIDYADTLQKQGFTIDNPNASGSCGCGDSFASEAADGCGCGSGPASASGCGCGCG